jgi:tetratricopeptide (TPR) repeat protein
MNDWSEAEQHVERAHELYEAGRWDEAEQALRHALSLNPFRAEWHFNLGLTLEAAGRYTDAAAALHAAHELQPDDGPTLSLLASVLLRDARAEDALKYLELAEDVESAKYDSFVHRIEAYAVLGRYDDAELMFYRALQDEEADHAQAYANMGEALMAKRDVERALFCFREAASRDAELPRIHARLAAAYAETGRQERARQLYQRELRDSPGDIDTLLDLGCLLVDMNRLADGAEKFRRVLELEPDNSDAHFFLGDVALRQQRRRDAEAAFKLVHRLDPAYPEVRRRLAELALDRSDLVEARKLLRREMREFREHPLLFTPSDIDDLGGLLLDARLNRDAERVFTAFTERSPKDSRAWHLLAVARFHVGNRDAAEEACRNALQINPRLVPALHNMALSAIQDRRWPRATHYIDRIHAVDPDDPALRRLKLTIRLCRLVDALSRSLGRLRRSSLSTGARKRLRR